MSKVEFDNYYRHALRLFWQAEFDVALKLMEQLSAVAPEDPRLLYGRAVCLFLLSRHDEAEVLCLELNNVFKDPRGEKLWTAIKMHRVEKPSQEEVAVLLGELPEFRAAQAFVSTKPRRRWMRRIISTFLVLALATAGAVAYPWIIRWHAQLGPMFVQKAQAPEMVVPQSSTPAAAANAADPAPVQEVTPPPPIVPEPGGPVEAPAAISDDRPSLAAHLGSLLDVVRPLLPRDSQPPSKPPWQRRLERLELAALPEGPVKTVMELQPYRTAQTLANARGDSITLTNLNPLVGAWYVLELKLGKMRQSLHLEVYPLASNVDQRPLLSLYADGLAVTLKQETQFFSLWPPREGMSSTTPDTTQINPAPVISETLQGALDATTPYSSLCGGVVLVRSQKLGATTQMELATDLLRQFRAGDWLVEKVKPMLVRAPEKAGTAEIATSSAATPTTVSAGSVPQSAWVAETAKDRVHKPKSLGIAAEAGDEGMLYGRWYPAANHPDIFVGVMTPAAIPADILSSYPERVAPLGVAGKGGNGESDDVAYLLAMDLARFGFGYAVGAEHPAVGWSTRVVPAPNQAGPDGFSTKAPLATIGSVPPWLSRAAVGVFAGGFKREHGAFKSGDLAKINQGSHFGFVENGVILSRLNPSLATVKITPDGGLDLLTWPEDVGREFRYVLHARQNGVPLIEGIDAAGISIPGQWVKDRGRGAWSGNADGVFLTIRYGIGIQEIEGRSFLILGYFTGATPNAMARVFQAYRCRYAMGLDMNSLSLCYTAFYVRDAEGNVTQAEYLIKQMAAYNGGNYLRFLERNDNRDCFYVYRR